jgi:hypothetical protein
LLIFGVLSDMIVALHREQLRQLRQVERRVAPGDRRRRPYRRGRGDYAAGADVDVDVDADADVDVDGDRDAGERPGRPAAGSETEAETGGPED